MGARVEEDELRMQIPTSGGAGRGSMNPIGPAPSVARAAGEADDGPASDAAAAGAVVAGRRLHTGAGERNIRCNSSVEMSGREYVLVPSEWSYRKTSKGSDCVYDRS